MTTETQESLLKRYAAAIEEFTHLAKNPSPDNQQRFESVLRMVSAMRQTIVRYGISLEEKESA